jgi:putative phage-type endonuclease
LIPQERFLVQSVDYEKWLEIRATGVTATMVGKAHDAKGFKEVLSQMSNPTPIPDNAYMAFGRDQEPHLISRLTERFEIEGNDWLIASDREPWMMATPDGLSGDHQTIVEVKTTGRDWGDYSRVPIYYQRQVQWQLFVTGAEECVFAWMLRATDRSGTFVPAWLGPKYVTVKRNERMITDCIDTAEKLYSLRPSV